MICIFNQFEPFVKVGFVYSITVTTDVSTLFNKAFW